MFFDDLVVESSAILYGWLTCGLQVVKDRAGRGLAAQIGAETHASQMVPSPNNLLTGSADEKENICPRTRVGAPNTAGYNWVDYPSTKFHPTLSPVRESPEDVRPGSADAFKKPTCLTQRMVADGSALPQNPRPGRVPFAEIGGSGYDMYATLTRKRDRKWSWRVQTEVKPLSRPKRKTLGRPKRKMEWNGPLGDRLANELFAELAAMEREEEVRRRATATVDDLAAEILADLAAMDAAARAAEFESLADNLLAELAAEDARVVASAFMHLPLDTLDWAEP